MSNETPLDLALAAVFVAGVALVLVVARTGSALVAAMPGSIEPLPWSWRLIWPLVLAFESPAALTLGERTRMRIGRRLQQAGSPRWLTPVRHRARCWLSGLVAAGFGTLAGWLAVPTPVSISEWLPAVLFLFGAMLPSIRLRDQAAARQRLLLRQLPFFLDIITLSVEAGLNLGASLAQAVDRGPPGPVRDEFALLLRDLRAGRPREEAMRALAARIDLAAMSSLVTALAGAQKHGLSLGAILRAQSEQRRSERFMRAEKLAMQAPVKMLLPLVLFIFPGTFVVLLYPVFSRLLAEGVL